MWKKTFDLKVMKQYITINNKQQQVLTCLNYSISLKDHCKTNLSFLMTGFTGKNVDVIVKVKPVVKKLKTNNNNS